MYQLACWESRRSSVLERVKRHHDKKRIAKQELLAEDKPQTRRSSASARKLTVAFNFEKKGHKKGAKSTVALNDALNNITDLEKQRTELIRERNRLKKMLQRIKNKETNLKSLHQNELEIDGRQEIQGLESLTPQSKADKTIREDGISPRKHKPVRKKLKFANVLQQEVKESKIRKTCKFNAAKKYRCIGAFGHTLGLNRKTITRKKENAKYKKLVIRKKVISFLEREDNCTIMPGKRDSISKGEKQKRILNDYLHHLHAKFCLENPTIKISRSTFSSIRPKHILLVNFCNRNTCLCSRHQNIALKIISIQEVAGTKNPDEFVKCSDEEIKDKLTKISKSTVTFTEWKKQDENGKLRWKQVQTTLEKQQFIDMLTKDVEEFRGHVNRVKNQYGQMKRLLENLSNGHVLVWMDFAENFTCAALDEVQSAYWSSEQVILHTTVVYFPEKNIKSHKSIVGISEVNTHNAGMVVAMISFQPYSNDQI